MGVFTGDERQPMAMTNVFLLVIVGASILLMLVRPRNIAEVWWVGGGALLLVGLRLVPMGIVTRAIGEARDVSLFLVGMMLLSELANVNGVFDWVSAHAVRGARGQCTRLFALIYGVGTLVTITLSNDATAVVLTPAILIAVRRANVRSVPFLFACAMIANAASFVLPISNPANLVVFHSAMPPLAEWLRAFLVPSLLSIVVTYVVLFVYFRKELRERIEVEVEAGPLTAGGRLVVGGLVVVVAVLLGASALNFDLGLPTFIAALAIMGAGCLKEKKNPLPLLRGISWTTLLLVVGLFIMVDAVESVGALRYTHAALEYVARLPVMAGVYLAGSVVGVANNLVNNLPLGLIAGATVHTAQVQRILVHAILIGVDLGPNLSVTGSLATILWLLAMRKEGLDISAWKFLKVGLLVMPLAMLASLSGLLLMNAFQ